MTYKISYLDHRGNRKSIMTDDRETAEEIGYAIADSFNAMVSVANADTCRFHYIDGTELFNSPPFKPFPADF